MCLLQIFSPVCGFSNSLDIVLCRTEQNINEVQLTNYFFRVSRLWCCPWKVIVKPKVLWVFFYVISRTSVFLCFTFQYMIHFELISVKGLRPSLVLFLCIWLSSYSSTMCWRDYLGSILLPEGFCPGKPCLPVWAWMSLHSGGRSLPCGLSSLWTQDALVIFQFVQLFTCC